MSEPLRIAMVGVTSSTDDASYLADVYSVIGIKLGERPRPVLDLIGLMLPKRSRDFLAEDFKYDVVAVCLVFKCAPHELSWQEQLYIAREPHIYRNSPLHSAENWRNRLLSTGAHTIVCFEEKTEVGHEYMGGLPGYLMERNDERMMTIYRLAE